jgi:proteasome lid subunit RPN8/RPN11
VNVTLAQDFGINMSEIVLIQDIIDSFLQHGEKDYPFECCGFILGHFIDEKSVGTEYIAIPNTKEENKERRFLIDPMAYQDAEDQADKQGVSIISIVHSHPNHSDLPSDFDKNHAWPGFSYIIISIIKGVAVSYRSWKLIQNRTKFIEEKITIIKEDKPND